MGRTSRLKRTSSPERCRTKYATTSTRQTASSPSIQHRADLEPDAFNPPSICYVACYTLYCQSFASWLLSSARRCLIAKEFQSASIVVDLGGDLEQLPNDGQTVSYVFRRTPTTLSRSRLRGSRPRSINEFDRQSVDS